MQSTFTKEAVDSIRSQVGTGRAICALSGGVDSSVAALLAHKTIGHNLICVFVDHGLLREGEVEQVVHTFKQGFNMNLIHVDAKRRFLDRLRGVVDPESKRKIIGEEFIRVFEEQAKAIGDVQYLVQGTLYPDVIESGGGNGRLVKSHHNVGGLPPDMDLKLIEPLRCLYKDQVRELGRELGLPDEITWRHPFPGPGLAVRIIGEVTEDRLNTLRQADAIVVDELKRSGWYSKIWQGFAVLPAMRSVGVMADSRTYSNTIAIRAIVSEDGMAGEWARLPLELLESISNRIVNQVPNVNRVVYDITSKPPATIEWE